VRDDCYVQMLNESLLVLTDMEAMDPMEVATAVDTEVATTEADTAAVTEADTAAATEAVTDADMEDIKQRLHCDCARQSVTCM
jgi:hypothetical protein